MQIAPEISPTVVFFIAPFNTRTACLLVQPRALPRPFMYYYLPPTDSRSSQRCANYPQTRKGVKSQRLHENQKHFSFNKGLGWSHILYTDMRGRIIRVSQMFAGHLWHPLEAKYYGSLRGAVLAFG